MVAGLCAGSVWTPAFLFCFSLLFLWLKEEKKPLHTREDIWEVFIAMQGCVRVLVCVFVSKSVNTVPDSDPLHPQALVLDSWECWVRSTEIMAADSLEVYITSRRIWDRQPSEADAERASSDDGCFWSGWLCSFFRLECWKSLLLC